MNDSRWGWLVGIVATAGTAVAGVWVRIKKGRQHRARTRDIDTDRLGKIIDRLEHEIDRLVKEVGCLQAENAAQAEQMAKLAKDHRDCDEKHRKLQLEVDALKSRL